ncbi:hypothetical protein [Pseudomonas sp. CF161]|uniref:hypothetical protein n=1 Tax=Pseudomonas sp. CF161 TaxID=911241 RepID=UPI0003550BDA|nr:hypothetical protein [Pseudomonas sp. CF161]EPL04421.1 hypothetical protein CF161_27249 [Pseudomonas sp. CF161]
MSKLQHLIAEARQGLSVMQSISDEKWRALATQCGAAERAEIRQRIQSLEAMSLEADEGDDEQRDDIRCAIDNLNLLLSLSEAHERAAGSSHKDC